MNIGSVGSSSAAYLQQLHQVQGHGAPAKSASLDQDHDGDVDTGGADTNDGKGKFVNVKA